LAAFITVGVGVLVVGVVPGEVVVVGTEVVFGVVVVLDEEVVLDPGVDFDACPLVPHAARIAATIPMLAATMTSRVVRNARGAPRRGCCGGVITVRSVS
jgi:hypothetical protein